MVLRLLRIAVACAVLQLPGLMLAQQSSGSADNLTLARAIELALARNPDLAATRYEIAAAEGRLVQADVGVNPELSAEFEDFAGTRTLSGIDALQSTLRISQVIELGDKRDLRVAVAESDLDLVGVEQKARELDVIAEVARRFISLVAAQERLQFAQAATALARQTLAAITERVDAARSPVAERSRAQIAVTRALIEEQQAGSELRGSRTSLVALWDEYEPTFAAASAELFRFEEGRTFQSFFDALLRSPDFLAFASEARLRDAEVRLAEARARPNIAVNLGLRRFEATDEFALVAGFSKPLAIRDRNRGAILEARARRAQTDAERAAAVARARATLFAVYAQMDAARTRADTLRNDALPQARTALAQTQEGYDAGRFSFLELATAQQDLLGLQEASIEAAAEYHTLRAELERLTSEPLTNTNPETSQP